MRWDDDERALDRRDQPRRPDAGALRRAWRTGRSIAPSCPASRASSRSPATRSTPAAGTTRTPAAIPTANLDRPARQARRHHRHRRDRRAVRAAPRRGGRASLRLPAHAVVDRRARQPPHRSGVGEEPRSRAGTSTAWTTSTSSSRAASRTRTWSATAGPTSSASCSSWCSRTRTAPVSRDGIVQDAGARRLPEDGADPRPRRLDRAGRGDRRGAQALLPAVLQAPLLPRRVPRDLQPAERHARRHARAGASSGSRRRASSSPASSTSSTA